MFYNLSSAESGNNEKWIAEWGQKTEGQIRTQKDMIAANQAARQSALDHNTALQKQTLGAKAAAVGMNLLKTALNSIAFIAITQAVVTLANTIITKFDDIVNAYQNGINKLKDLVNSQSKCNSAT